MRVRSHARIAQASRTTLAEPAFQQMLLDSGIEPTREFKPTNLSVVARGGSRPLGARRQRARLIRFVNSAVARQHLGGKRRPARDNKAGRPERASAEPSV